VQEHLDEEYLGSYVLTQAHRGENMSTLLHIDSSFNHTTSVSREISAAFASAWKAAHPAGKYIYRDLAGDTLAHLDSAAFAAARTDEGQHTPEQAERWAVTKVIVDELLAADTIVIGAPMYNYSVASTLKAWLDRIAIPRLMVNRDTGDGPLVGKKVVVVTARGGSYAPGAPRAHFDFQEPYLRAFFSQLGLERDLTFVHSEFTMAAVVPALAQFKDKAAASREAARHAVQRLAAA
jgi:FMN-dependent NADH-azoreductase